MSLWEPVSIAPFDRDLELALIDSGGFHRLVFPCRRVPDDWIDATTRRGRIGAIGSVGRQQDAFRGDQPVGHRLRGLAMNDQQTKELVIAGRTSKVEWTRDDTIKALGQGWGLFTEHNKVMRVLRVDSKPITGIDLKPRVVFPTDESARTWVKQRATAGSELHRRAWTLDGKMNRQAPD